jgi:type II secretory pathway pseudopilin PulG
MIQEGSKEPNKQPAQTGSWLTYVVVVFILIFVLGLVFAPMSRARYPRLSAETAESQIETACLAYLAEYGTLPATSENYRLVKILTGENNPRAITFITLKPTDMTANGELQDPWGTPYRITFDSNSKIHVMSAGPDKVFGTPDDVTNQP